MYADDWQLRVSEVTNSGGWKNDLTAWSFLLLREGAGTFSGRSIPSRLRQGDVLVVPSGVEGRLAPKSGGGLVLLHFHFHSELLNEFLRLEERHWMKALVEGVKRYPATTPLAHRFRFMAERMAPPDKLLHRCQLLELVGMFLDLHRNNPRTIPGESVDGKDRVRAVVEQMSRDELERLSVGELAKRCGCSRRHFNRILKVYLGSSLGMLKIELRLEKAASMLLSPGTKVINVALDCGFTNAGQFSAKFRSRFGTNPAAWRRERLRERANTEAPAIASASLKSNIPVGRPGVLKLRAARA
jgi:AraC-like DNA-binding protein